LAIAGRHSSARISERARRIGAPRRPIADATRLIDRATREEGSLEPPSALPVAMRSANFPIPPTDTASSLPRIGSVQR